MKYVDEFVWERLREAAARMNAGEPHPGVRDREDGREAERIMRHARGQARLDTREIRTLAARWKDHPDYRADEWRVGESPEDAFFDALIGIRKAREEL